MGAFWAQPGPATVLSSVYFIFGQLFIHSFTYSTIFVEDLLCARHGARCWSIQYAGLAT